MPSTRKNGALTSGELARAVGVSPDTIRHYEKLGLLPKPPRTEGRYRLYPSDSLDRVNLIRSALTAGFTLAELARIFKDRNAGKAPCNYVAGLAKGKILSLDDQIRGLTNLRKWLGSTVTQWNKRLKQTPAGTRSGLLESLPEHKDLKRIISKGTHNESSSPRPRSLRFSSR